MSDSILGVGVWITGGSGFIGSHLVRRLLARGAAVTLLTSDLFDERRLADCAGRLRSHPIERVRELLAVDRPGVVYHLASTPFQPASTPAVEHGRVIFHGTMELLEALREAPPRRFVFAGSAAEYGDGSQLSECSPCRPTTVLGATKLAAATLVASYGRMLHMETVHARLFTPFGPWEKPDRLIPYTIASAIRGAAVKLRGDGSQERDFLYVEDAAEALAAMGSCCLQGNPVFNISSGEGRSVKEVAGRVLSRMGSRVPVEFEKQAARADEIRVCSGDSSLARDVFGWRASTALDQGIDKTIEWFRENPEWLQSQRN